MPAAVSLGLNLLAFHGAAGALGQGAYLAAGLVTTGAVGMTVAVIACLVADTSPRRSPTVRPCSAAWVRRAGA